MCPYFSRRDAIHQLVSITVITLAARSAVGAGRAAGPVGRNGTTAPLPHLSETDPYAEALAYRTDAKSVDRAAQPQYRTGQTCANCASVAGAATDQWRPCALIPGYLVSAGGWCQMYATKEQKA